jgi:hypothetical protein
MDFSGYLVRSFGNTRSISKFNTLYELGIHDISDSGHVSRSCNCGILNISRSGHFTPYSVVIFNSYFIQVCIVNIVNYLLRWANVINLFKHSYMCFIDLLLIFPDITEGNILFSNLTTVFFVYIFGGSAFNSLIVIVVLIVNISIFELFAVLG